MKTLRVLIVDDERLARSRIRKLLKKRELITVAPNALRRRTCLLASSGLFTGLENGASHPQMMSPVLYTRGPNVRPVSTISANVKIVWLRTDTSRIVVTPYASCAISAQLRSG